MTVYVVTGTKGEYSDYEMWVVAVLASEAAAKKRVVDASARSREIYTEYRRAAQAAGSYRDIEPGRNEHDPLRVINSGGCWDYHEYTYVEMEVLDA